MVKKPFLNVKTIWGSSQGSKSITDLQNLIKKRMEILKHESTENASTATAINILKSLRADTKVITRNPVVIQKKYTTEITDTSYHSGWAYPGLHNKKGRRVIRQGKGHGLLTDPETGNRVVNKAGSSVNSDKVIKVFRLKIFSNSSSGKPFYNSLILAVSKNDIVQFAQQRIIRRAKQYKGVCRKLLGFAMRKLGSRVGNVKNPNVPQNTNPLPDERIDRLAIIRKSNSGYNTGNYSISFIDNLEDSIDSLKSGSSGVQLAMKKAINATIGYLNRILDRRFEDRISTPFPELSHKR